ncbi:MAG: hypothetical protein ABIV26_01455 [Candidatus Limnocylindrales bacterium]
MNRRFFAAVAAILLAVAIPASAIATPASSPFAGRWTSTDTDGSSQLLVVSGGASPSVVYQDFYASGCDNHGGPATHWVGAGQGDIEGDTLVVEFHKSGCGNFLQGGYEDWYAYDAGADTLVDGFGIEWSRSN